MVDSGDVTRSIGRDTFLSSRMGAGAVGAPKLEVSFVPALRPDLFAQRVLATSKPILDVPHGLEGWLASMFEPIAIPDDTVLMVLSMTGALDKYLRHVQHGFIVSAPTGVTKDDQEWLNANFEAAPLNVAAMTKAIESLTNLQGVNTEIVVYNVSTCFPEEGKRRTVDLNSRSVLANQLDLIGDIAARDTRSYVVDVDRIVAEVGAAEAVVTANRYSDEVYDIVAEEALSLILDLPGINAIFGTEVMHLAVPRYDRRTETGVLIEWHVEAPSQVEAGDSLFDIRYDDISWKLNSDRRPTGRYFTLSVVASRGGFLKEIVVRPGESVAAGSKVGVMTLAPDSDYEDFENTSRFPVGVKMVER